MADVSQLLGVRRCDEHADAVGGGLGDQVVNRDLRTNIDTLCWLVEQQDARLRPQPFSQYDLLLVPAAEERQPSLDVGRPHVKPRYPAACFSSFPPRFHAKQGATEQPNLWKRQILAYAHVRDQDRKSTRLNSSHTVISYAVFC